MNDTVEDQDRPRRRTFLATIGAMTASFVAGCSDEEDPPTTSPPVTTTTTTTPPTTSADPTTTRQRTTSTTTGTPTEKPETASTQRLHRSPYPRAFFFRQSANTAANGMPYARWEALFRPLGGIMGKVLNEELPDRSEARSHFARFKERNPEKAAFVHFNGLARDPRFDRDGFFAGHWLYRPGTELTGPVSAERGTTRFDVADHSVFSTAVGFGGRHADHVAVVPVDSDGDRDWARAEQVRVESIDERDGTIQVERGVFGTDPRSFDAGAYLAPHSYDGPWASGNLLWRYNFSTACPRDERGRDAVDALVEDLATKFDDGGVLAPFDGIQFDLSRFIFAHRGDVDANVDGVADGGIIDGTNTYGLGKVRLAAQLRDRLDSDTLVMADGWRWGQRPSFASYNGIESEGWPSLKDRQFEGWSSGINRHRFWSANGVEPRFSYINHKFAGMDRRDPDYSRWRLVFAAAMFTDAGITYSYWVPSDDRNPGVFDELWRGVDETPNWLGMPEGGPVHVPERSTDLLGGRGTEWAQRFVDRFETGGSSLARRRDPDAGPVLVVSCDDCGSGSFSVTYDPPTLPPMADYDMPRMTATLPGIEVAGPDLFSSLTLRADPLAAYPPAIGRRVKATAEVRDTGERIRAFTWANEQPFDAVFYFRDIGPGTVDLNFQFEGGTPVYLHRLQVYSAPDAMYREFEGGIVFANPSNRSYTFDVDALFPDTNLRRIQGSGSQDPVTNDGQQIRDELTLDRRDGLATIKE